MPHRDLYFLGHSTAEQQRLQQQAGELAEESAWLFDQIGLAPGSRAVEVGCGPQGCLELLSTRVGPAGSVIGIDMSGDAVDLARSFLSNRGIRNVEVRHGNAATAGLPRESFDLATARLVLVNIPEPDKIVAEMAALVKPGGAVAMHEADWLMHVCDPPLAAWDRLLQVLQAYSEAHGIDLYIGRRLTRMLRDAGLAEVRTRALVHVYEAGHSRRPLFLQFARNLRERIVAARLISETEFDAAIKALESHLDDPATLVFSHLYVQAWGRKP